jgi:hypothetical protein
MHSSAAFNMIEMNGKGKNNSASYPDALGQHEVLARTLWPLCAQ